MEQEDTKIPAPVKSGDPGFFPPAIASSLEDKADKLVGKIIGETFQAIIRAGNAKLYGGVLYRLYELEAAAEENVEEKNIEVAPSSPPSPPTPRG